MLPRKPAPTFGFVDNAETWNSRAAMVRRQPCLSSVLSPACIVPPFAQSPRRCEEIYSPFAVAAPQIGFFSLLAVEAIAGKGILELVGVTVGKGLNIAL